MTTAVASFIRQYDGLQKYFARKETCYVSSPTEVLLPKITRNTGLSGSNTYERGAGPYSLRLRGCICCFWEDGSRLNLGPVHVTSCKFYFYSCYCAVVVFLVLGCVYSDRYFSTKLTFYILVLLVQRCSWGRRSQKSLRFGMSGHSETRPVYRLLLDYKNSQSHSTCAWTSTGICCIRTSPVSLRERRTVRSAGCKLAFAAE